VTAAYLAAEVSFVIAIKQTNQSTNQERPCTTIQEIKKMLQTVNPYLVLTR